MADRNVRPPLHSKTRKAPFVLTRGFLRFVVRWRLLVVAVDHFVFGVDRSVAALVGSGVAV